MDSEDESKEVISIMKDLHQKLVQEYPIMKPMCDMYEVIMEQAFREQDESENGKLSVTTQIIVHNVEQLFQDSVIAAKMTDMFVNGDIDKVLSEAGIDLSAMMGEDEPVTKDDSGENKVIPFPKNKLH